MNGEKPTATPSANAAAVRSGVSCMCRIACIHFSRAARVHIVSEVDETLRERFHASAGVQPCACFSREMADPRRLQPSATVHRAEKPPCPARRHGEQELVV